MYGTTVNLLKSEFLNIYGDHGANTDSFLIGADKIRGDMITVSI